ncbi:anti-sigma factor family protein [Planctomicrobium sp. SH664]|uniref:anti-sigma factor family protein n=1 Tax=Planctomicrobium sp. SH664 TaxID=3448125 RepID=UPI003F5AE8D5
MSKPIAEELLSAYLDGELSPEERAEAERLLRDCTLHRDCMEELIELSQTLRGLPCCSAPNELRDLVLGKLSQVSSTASALAGGQAPTRRAVWTRLSSLTVAALLLTLTIMLVNRREEPAGPDRTIATLPPSSIPNAEISMMAQPAAVPLPEAVAVDSAPIIELNRQEIVRKLMELEHRPQPGNSIRVVDADVVVEFTVVDVNEAYNQLKVLLKQKQVRSLDEVRPELDGGAPFASTMRTVCIDLEGTNAELADVLHQIPALAARMYVEEVPEAHPPQLSPEAPILAELDPGLPPALQAQSRATETSPDDQSLIPGALVSQQRNFSFNVADERVQQRKRGALEQQKQQQQKFAPPSQERETPSISSFGASGSQFRGPSSPSHGDAALKTQAAPLGRTLPPPSAAEQDPSQILKAKVFLLPSRRSPLQRIPKQ